MPFLSGRIRQLFFGIVLMTVTAANVVCAAEFEPFINLAEYYTDNLFLVPDELKESDWVTQVLPGIKIDHESSRLIVDFAYAYQAIFYLDNDQFNDGYHQLDSSLWADLVGEELRLFVSAAATQVNVSPQDPQTPSNIPVTGNRSNGNTLQLGPQWKQRLFLGSEINAFAYFGKVTFSSPDSQDIDPLRVSAILQPYDSAYRTKYRTSYSYVSLDYERSGTIIDQSLLQGISYELNEVTALTALVGLESNLNDPFDGSLSEWRWDVGVDTGSGDNSFSASIGSRYFGTNIGVSWLRSSPKRLFSLSYHERPSNTDLLNLHEIPNDPKNPDAPPPPPNPDSGLDTPGVPGRFIEKNFGTSLSFLGYRYTVTVTGYLHQQISLIPDVPDAESIGAIVSFNRPLGIKTNFDSEINWQRRDAFFTDPDTGARSLQGSDVQYRFSVMLSHALGEANTLRLKGDYDIRESPVNELANYDATLIMFSWTKDF